ncbi:hypothetical protein WG68_07735 [Arsukibacterium ikkense]|uniref:Phospholipase/carboxylesterase/thioesterase domain-containing protein n=1 Tax=Arsukibacterium ikkense TaxID=336831 RepID=A0A0M2V5I3_9GAMM|nr:hypothetical protein [Arsukibacterium ikkense]KKO45896.1 hypothetical protein WG68_07735 [Arsukibacterium ikkense]
MWNTKSTRIAAALTSLLAVSGLTACGGGSADNDAPVSANDCAMFGTGAICDIAAGRRFQLIVPATTTTSPRPVLLAFHGSPPSFGTPAKLNQFLALQKFADDYGYLIALPQGGDDWAWTSELQAASAHSADTRYALQVIDRLVSAHNADGNKVATVGFSAGAMMSYQLVCQTPERVKAAFTISGQAVGPLTACQPALPVALHHLHGTQDPDMPLAGRVSVSGKLINSLDNTIARFQQINGCATNYTQSAPWQLQTAGNLATSFEYQGCLQATGYTLVDTFEHQPDYVKSALHQLMHQLFDSAF